jgi:hypothetical protein
LPVRFSRSGYCDLLRAASRIGNRVRFGGMRAAGYLSFTARLVERVGRDRSSDRTTQQSGEIMLKMTRLAALAAILFIAVAATVVLKRRARKRAIPCARRCSCASACRRTRRPDGAERTRSKGGQRLEVDRIGG